MQVAINGQSEEESYTLIYLHTGLVILEVGNLFHFSQGLNELKKSSFLYNIYILKIVTDLTT